MEMIFRFVTIQDKANYVKNVMLEGCHSFAKKIADTVILQENRQLVIEDI